MEIFVMPAWIAGIQVRKDASGDIHVNLDFSTPCWNDVIEGVVLELTGIPPPVFSKEARSLRLQISEPFVSFVVKIVFPHFA